MQHTHFVDGLVSRGKRFKDTTAMLKENAVFLSDEEYGRVLSAVVVSCVDVALIHAGMLLIGLRVNEPYKDGWAFPGGRMKPGESFSDTAARHARALGLRMSPRRFRVVRTDSWAWSRRAQPPQEMGCHMTGTTVCAEVSFCEATRATNNPGGDLVEMRWMPIPEILRNRKIHPVHRAAAKNIAAGEFQRA